MSLSLWSSEYSQDPEFSELLTEYIRELPKSLNLIRDQFNQGEHENAQQEVHRLKGSAGMYGYWYYSKLAAEVELMIEGGKSQEVISGLDKLDHAARKIAEIHRNQSRSAGMPDPDH